MFQGNPLAFGSGALWAIPTFDITGVAITTPTPVAFGALQDVTLDISMTEKALYGMYSFPLEIAGAEGKVTGKAKFARISGLLFNLLFGEILNAGETRTVVNESDSIPANTPYTVTVAQSATWVLDLGVFYGATGAMLQRVSSSPSAGQYSVAAGVYTFAAADASKAIFISYTYSYTTTQGQSVILNNHLMGARPKFQVVLRGYFPPNYLYLTLNRCISTKLALGTKLNDWTIPEMDFSAMADDSNLIGSASYASL